MTARAPSSPSPILGAACLALLAVLVGSTAWLFTGTLASLASGIELEVVFVSRPAIELVAWIAVSLAALLTGHAITVSSAARTWTERLETHRLSYLWPLALSGLPILATILLATPLSRVAMPWLYLFIDMRWWLVAATAFLLTFALDVQSDRRWSRRASTAISRMAQRPSAGLWIEIGLVAALTLPALVASPAFRFQSTVLGDEPKYLRFAENWYRGRGFDVAGLEPIADRPLQEGPDLAGNVRRLGPALAVIASDLADDVARIVGAGATVPPRSPGGIDWFVDGKRGGTYQAHNPGFSALLFPGYIIDRWFLNWTSVYHPQFPTNLYATSGTVLLLYLAWGVALYRLLRVHSGRTGLSLLLTLVAFLSLPASAFHHQYYPEVAAGLVLTMLLLYVLASPDEGRGRALYYGALTGYLPWVHPRFGPALLVVLGAVAVTRRRSPATIAWFSVGLLAPLGALGLYNYHIAGDMMPWALYAAIEGGSEFSLRRMWSDWPYFWLDWRGGIISHAPIYLLALPGVLLFWRRPRVALPVTLVIVLTAALAAAHTWHGSGTTPLRLVAAVIPLLMLPMADAFVRFSRSRVFVVAFAILAAVSVQNGLTYNRHMIKDDSAALSGPSVSGWKTPLLLVEPEQVAPSTPVFYAWAAVLAGLLIAPLIGRRDGGDAPHAIGPWVAATAAGLVLFASVGSALAAWTDRRFYDRYLEDAEDARARIVAAYLRSPGGVSTSSLRGRIDVPLAFSNPDAPTLSVTPDGFFVQAGDVVPVTIAARGADGSAAWGSVSVDFGDGSSVARLPVMGTAEVRHTYRQPGAYALTVSLDAPGAPPQRLTRAVEIVPAEGPAVPAGDEGTFRIPPILANRAPSFTVDRVAIGASDVELRLTLPRRLRQSTTFSVWTAFDPDFGERVPRLYQAERAGDAPDGITTLRFSPDPWPGDAERVGIVVTVAADGSIAHSGVVPVRWPPQRITQGAAVVVR